MKLMIIAVLAVMGLILGSFVNALTWRFHEQAEVLERGAKKKADKQYLQELSMVKGHSMCSHCHHELAPKDLVPLFSWLLLRGKCRYCGVKIEDSPLIEALLPVFLVISYLAWPTALHGEGLYHFIFWLLFLVGFMALAAYDIRWYLLPNRIVYPLIAVAILEIIGEFVFYHAGWSTLTAAIWGVIFVSGIFYLLFSLSDGTWIGGGDVKLGVVLGLLVGGPLDSLLVIFLASLLGSLVAVPLLALGKAGRTSHLPFGPYLLLATVIVTIYGSDIINWYERLIGFN